MLTMGRYYNTNSHLPDAPGRTWYEADINYMTAEETDTECCGQMTD